MTYGEILSRFTVKHTNGSKAQCICPAHDDREASLTISEGEKGTVVHCHAGCSTEAVLSAVGLTVSDLFEGAAASGEAWRAYVEGREKRKVEDVYNYVDLTGEYAFTRLRMTGKKFIYGRLTGDSFSFGLNGQSRKSIPAVFCKSLKALQTAAETGDRIFYAEGEKDVRSLISHGLTGVTCGAAGDWVPEVAELFRGAAVVVLADNDLPGMRSARLIADNLQGVAASVVVVVPTPEIEHGDISDFFQDGHTVKELEDLISKAIAQDVTEEKPLNLDQFHMITDSGKVTGVYDFRIFDYLRENQDLFVLGGVPYLYRGGCYRPDYSGAELKTKIRDLIYPEYVKSTTIKRVYDLFLSAAELQVTAEDLNNYPAEWVCFRNGFYDPIQKKMIPHDPKYRVVNQIPHDYDPEAKLNGATIERWLAFITEDPEDREMLLQYCGYCMTRDTAQQKFLILNGEGGSGKSTVIRLLESVIGPENISNVSLCQLTQRFAAFGLMGKLLNSCADLEVSALEDVSTLKKLLGEDRISAESKGRDAISFKNYAKLVFSTNELPIVKTEKTGGFYRRLLILTMNKVPTNKRPDFFRELSAELDYFIHISMDALGRMYGNGYITESSGSVEAVKRLRCDSDSVEAFLSTLTHDPNVKTKKGDLYRHYENYCQEMERQPLRKQGFYRAMKTKGYSELKTGGIEYYRGISVFKISPKISPFLPSDDWETVTDNESPFR